MRDETLLVVDDQTASRTHLASRLEEAGFQVVEASDGEEGWEAFRKHKPSLVLTDLRMPRADGLELLSTIREVSDVPVILLTAFGDVSSAVAAMKEGAQEFLSFDDLNIDQLIERVQELLAVGLPCEEQTRLAEHLQGSSSQIANLRERVAGLITTNVPVLVTGEVGTGRTRVARCLDALGTQSGGSFTEISGAIATGTEDLPARGSVFLCDVDRMTLDAQDLWLERVQKAMEDDYTGPRIIASTSLDLVEQAGQGSFKLDLAELLSRFRLHVPALRDRLEDIEDVSHSMLADISERLDRRRPKLSVAAFGRLREHRWPGNLRELAGVLEKVVVYSTKSEITRAQIEDILSERKDSVQALRELRSREERDTLISALRQAGGNLTRAAEFLGKSRGAVRHQAKKYGLI